ncbi:structural constituent of ribosome [Branchiostoma belcheri]|nr:structural constituent of ribosome [Branchiostoma belcheri]
MAGSRLEKFGTIFTRVRDLIRGGVMKHEERPLWYDVYAAFPPRDPPLAERSYDIKPVRQILYPEDKIRAAFYKTYSTPRPMDLTNPDAVSECQKFILKYQQLERLGKYQEEAELFEAAARALQRDGVILKKRQLKQATDTVTTEEPQRQKDPALNIRISDMIKEALQKSETEKS